MLQSAHRPEPCFQPSVICLDRVVRMLLNGVQGGENQLIEHSRISRLDDSKTWTPTRKDHQQTRAAISQLAGPAAHGTVPEDADL